MQNFQCVCLFGSQEVMMQVPLRCLLDLGVGSNSIYCNGCKHWVHKKCHGCVGSIFRVKVTERNISLLSKDYHRGCITQFRVRAFFVFTQNTNRQTLGVAAPLPTCCARHFKVRFLGKGLESVKVEKVYHECEEGGVYRNWYSPYKV